MEKGCLFNDIAFFCFFFKTFLSNDLSRYDASMTDLPNMAGMDLGTDNNAWNVLQGLQFFLNGKIHLTKPRAMIVKGTQKHTYFQIGILF